MSEITIDAHSESIYFSHDNEVWATVHDGDYAGGFEDITFLYLRAYHSGSLDKYRIARNALRFDTTPIPADAIIVSATLKLYFHVAFNYGNSTVCPLYAESHVWNSGYVTEWHDVLAYVQPISTPVVTDEVVIEGYTSFVLNAAGLSMIHNATGAMEAGQERGTVIPIRFRHDSLNILPGDGATSGGFARHAGSRGSNPPQLVVVYTSTMHIVQTDAATSITKNSATLNGTLTEDADETCQCNFEYGLTMSLGSSTTPEGKTEGQTFSSDLTDLLPGTKYYFRAKAVHPTLGTVYGSILNFTTSGASYPVEAITRVTNLIHRYSRADGEYTLEMNLGSVTSDFGLPEWLSEPMSALLKKPGPLYGPFSYPITRQVPTETPIYGPFSYPTQTQQVPPYEPGPYSTTKSIPEPMPRSIEPQITMETLRETGKVIKSTWKRLTPWKEETGETFGSEIMERVTSISKFFGRLFR